MNYDDRMTGPIRFVGGSKHNEIVWLGRWLPDIQVPIYPKQSALLWPPPAKFTKTLIKMEVYTLHQFETFYRTRFFQYVVSTLSPEAQEVCNEEFDGVERFEVNLYPLLLAAKGKRLQR